MSLRDLSRAVWILAATVVLIYVLTLAIFPGVLAKDVSNSNLGSWRAPAIPCTLSSAAPSVHVPLVLARRTQLEGCSHSPTSWPCPPACALCLWLGWGMWPPLSGHGLS